MLTRASRRIVAFVLMLTMLGSSFPATASLSGSLDAMINLTPPAMHSAQDRGALVGGNIAIRVPARNVQLFYFDPPRLSAGCGGIDMYLGSFSFINADAFKGMLKAIAQGAAGYFFDLALNAICPPCQSILASLRNLSTIMNNNAVNSCKTARDLANWGMDAYKDFDKAWERAQESAKQWVDDAGGLNANGALSDWFSRFQSIFTNPGQVAEATKKYTPESGNAVWKALVTNSTSLGLFDSTGSGMPIIGDQIELANTLISLLGTVVIIRQKSTAEGAPASPDPTRDQMCASNPASCGADVKRYNPLLTFQNIMKGSENGTAKMWTCYAEKGAGLEIDLNNAYGCLYLNDDTVFNFMGTDKFVNFNLFCNAGTAVPTTTVAAPEACYMGGSVEADSIVGRITRGQELLPAQIIFLNNFRQPIRRLLMEVQRSPEAAQLIATTFAPSMSIEMASSIGSVMTRVARAAFSKNTDAMFPPEVRATLDTFSEQVALARKSDTELGKNIVAAVDLAVKIRTMDPVVISTSFRP